MDGVAESGGDEIRDQDRLLPIANISRIMKRVLPEQAKMSKEAKSAIQECVTEFIGFITSESSDRLIEDKRKTITGDDIVESMKALGFDAYMELLQIYLKKYRSSTKGIRLPTSGIASVNAATVLAGAAGLVNPSKRGRKEKVKEEESESESDSEENSDSDSSEEKKPKKKSKN